MHTRATECDTTREHYLPFGNSIERVKEQKITTKKYYLLAFKQKM